MYGIIRLFSGCHARPQVLVCPLFVHHRHYIDLFGRLLSFEEEFLLVRLSDFTSQADLAASPNIHKSVPLQLEEIFGHSIFSPLDKVMLISASRFIAN